MGLHDFEIYHARSTRINVHRVYKFIKLAFGSFAVINNSASSINRNRNFGDKSFRINCKGQNPRLPLFVNGAPSVLNFTVNKNSDSIQLVCKIF